MARTARKVELDVQMMANLIRRLYKEKRKANRY